MKLNKEDKQQHGGVSSEVQAIINQLNEIVKDWQVTNQADESDFKVQKDGEIVLMQSLRFEEIAEAWTEKIEPLMKKLLKLKGVKVDPEKIKFPLSEIDYLRIRGMDLLNDGYSRDFWNKASPELNDAYDEMKFDCLYQKYPNCGAWDEDVFWTKPCSITLENVNEIKDPLAWWVAMKYIIKEMNFERSMCEALEKLPELKSIIEKTRNEKHDND